MDRRYLDAIAIKFGGGPVGVETIAAALSEPRDAIEDIIEPYLIQQGFVQRTPRGRLLTSHAFRHLGLAEPRRETPQPNLFEDETIASGDDRRRAVPSLSSLRRACLVTAAVALANVGAKPREITRRSPTKARMSAPTLRGLISPPSGRARRARSRATSRRRACAGFMRGRAGRADGLSAASLARRLSAIRQFHKHLYAEGWRRDDPTLAIEGPRRARPLPKILSMAEVERLIATAREGLDVAERPLRERLAAARMACLIELIYASGLRVSEALEPARSRRRGQGRR